MHAVANQFEGVFCVVRSGMCKGSKCGDPLGLKPKVLH